ncbi:hypothetical protein LguiB_000625 [Lonicera macranthoides]
MEKFKRQLKKQSDELEAKNSYGYVEIDPTGRYGRLDEVLGKGAMKTVYKAMDLILGIEVAWSQVKLNDLMQSPEDLQRLYKEVHLLRILNHDSIVRIYASWIDDDRRTFNFITEMFTSGTLGEYKKKYKRIDHGATKIWIRQILECLVFLHSHDPPVIHRDLKCDNIFVNGHSGQVKIGDFGLAAILRNSHTAHSVIGTPEFMAPEIYEESYNELVDVYSFGMCVLEMLTCEYPYSECTNPAQIYKKVTSRKLPMAFYKVKDVEAQRFIGKCLVDASKRPSAKELLLDPFLRTNEDKLLSVTMGRYQKPFLNDEIGFEERRLNENPPRTNISITGILNPEGDTIFLKVQVADEEGPLRNIDFPFDITKDTPVEVATEMVEELGIKDWEPFEVADMIEAEISALVPHWKKQTSPNSDELHIFDDQKYYADHHYPFPPSSCSSSDVSLSVLIASHCMDERTCVSSLLQDDLFDDTSSQSSLLSGKYSYSNIYYSDHEQDYDLSPTKIVTRNSTRFCNGENSSTVNSMAENCNKVKYAMDRRILTRNMSLVDKRSQLHHQSIVEEANKRRLFKTVGAVENIGFQPPCGVSSKVSQRVSGGASLVKTRDHGKRVEHKG